MWIKIDGLPHSERIDPVTSFTLVWIKICETKKRISKDLVTSFTLVWIKIPGNTYRHAP